MAGRGNTAHSFCSSQCELGFCAESRKTNCFDEEKNPDGGFAVRLTACVQASGVQTKPRDAHVNVEVVSHGKSNIVLLCLAAIAAKARM